MTYHMQDLLLESQRITGTRRPITIIDPSKYNVFFARLKDASGISLEFKAYLAVSLSGGLRVSETLALRGPDFDLEKGFFRLKVLKKRDKIQGTNGEIKAHKVYRDAMLHPVALELLKQYLAQVKRRHYDYIFHFDRHYVKAKIKELFGPNACSHSMARHSHITWLLQEKREPELTVARIMEISARVVASYNHVNRRAELARLYAN